MGARILTHCNAGGLATAGYGTALGVVRGAVEAGRRPFVWVDETRPVLQGARLTAWELVREGIPHAVIADVAAASTMARGEVDLVVVGADRIAANGDTANKIGTYGVAVLARHHGIPFYVAAPFSTIDPADRRRIGHSHRGARSPRGPGARRPAHRPGGLPGPEPGLRRHPGRAHHRDRHGARHLPPPVSLRGVARASARLLKESPMKKYHLLAPGPDPDSPGGAPGDRPADPPPSDAGVRGAVRPGAGRPRRADRDAERGHRPGGVGHRCAGGGGRQRAARPGTRSWSSSAASSASAGPTSRRAFGLTVHGIHAPYGETVPPERVAAALRAHPKARALFVTQSETSTGVLEDVEAYAALTRRTDTLCVVDTVSSLGVVPCPMDAWGIDVGRRGLAEGAHVPPGACVRRAERPGVAGGRAGAGVRASTGTSRSSGAGRRRTRVSSRPPCRSWRASTSALRLLQAEGLPEVYRRHDRLARAARAGGRGARSRALRPGDAEPGGDGDRRRRRASTGGGRAGVRLGRQHHHRRAGRAR